ncbi:hypothetical protein SERLADRAFT_405462 [Serpula lacrymans var. lacrymans S7.9]|uniref:Alpha-type protein kinase domain-containing protein n=1 Tax=Serpula lacrymans var. lacrymans (strain S7.9) TaxID=578457 RepID=F8NHW2_SERL9|nr:uncharacterized protein SERLADRAFT_405462 [Serpula lacrymans var. lacrymans S7.9]EGO29472.1 hypothetical protein SERLADRAFT_405462 [Serpula lacrymans var. lacrymans S7.9]
MSKSKAPKKYHIPLIPINLDMRDNAENMLKQMLMKASHIYEESSKGCNSSATECFHLEQGYTSGVTVGQMYNWIKLMGVLSDKDKKRNALSLWLLLNEPTYPDKDELDEDFTMKSARKSLASGVKASPSTRQSKRKLQSAGILSVSKRAKLYSVNLPRIKWNAKGTFVGMVTTEIPRKPTDGSEDDCTLLFKTFLAAPLLLCDGLYKERKFCGNTDITQNEDSLGLVIDAYVYHTLLDSGKTVLLSDLQGIIAPNATVTLFDPQAHTYDNTLLTLFA